MAFRFPGLCALCTVCVLGSWASSSPAAAKTGFTLQRYEPTAAGEYSFWVDHPKYEKRFGLAAGLTFDYGHNPLVLGWQDGTTFHKRQSLIEHQFYGHLDVAVSLFNRLLVTATLPVALYQGGPSAAGFNPASTAVGDPRIGVMARLYGESMSSPFSLHLGLDVWIPVGANGNYTGDAGVRASPKLVMAGLTHNVQWSFLAAWLYRPDAVIGNVPATSQNGAGSELHFGAAIAYADMERRFTVGPEMMVSTALTRGNVFTQGHTNLEILLGANKKFLDLLMVGVAGGIGALRQAGTPDGRVILRIAYAPEPRPAPPDADGDGIPDALDACPNEKGMATKDPTTTGCMDRDGDGVVDRKDRCPEVPMGRTPDPDQPGCPRKDTDGDGIFDGVDACPKAPGKATGDPRTTGCPDSDGDAIVDILDACPTEPGIPTDDPRTNGCPDRDKDGVVDLQDQCPDDPQGLQPHPTKPGCPLLTNQKIVVEPIPFENGKAAILAVSVPVLQRVVAVMKEHPEIGTVTIEGHTDNVGKPEANLALSRLRAKSVMDWMVGHKIPTSRLKSSGYGQTKPVASNDDELGRSQNRRVEFLIGPAAVKQEKAQPRKKVEPTGAGKKSDANARKPTPPSPPPPKSR